MCTMTASCDHPLVTSVVSDPVVLIARHALTGGLVLCW